jgi:hypothetical protein
VVSTSVAANRRRSLATIGAIDKELHKLLTAACKPARSAALRESDESKGLSSGHWTLVTGNWHLVTDTSRLPRVRRSAASRPANFYLLTAHS